MGARIIPLGPFTKGVNLVDDPTQLEPNELAWCSNFRTGRLGNFQKRPGHTWYGDTPAKVLGNVHVNFLFRYLKKDGTKQLLAAAGGKLKKGNDVTGAWTQIDIDGVAGNNMEATLLADTMTYKDRVYITDGIRPQRYDGTNNIYAGHVIKAAPTLTGAAGGALTAGKTYKYRVAAIQGDLGEGPYGAEATIAMGANTRVNLTNILDEAAKYGETQKQIYRTKGDGNIFYKLATINTGTTTYTDNIADTALGAEYIPVSAPPSDARFVIVGHDERTRYFGRSGVNASIVNVSEVGFPDRVKDSDFFSISNNDNDIIIGAGLSPAGILWLKRGSCWLERSYGFGLQNIQPKDPKTGGVGSTSRFSIVPTPVGIIFLSQRGEVYLFDSTNLVEIGYKVSSEFKDMSENAMSRVIATYHDNRYIISYDFRGSKGCNWRTLEYDVFTGKWEGPHENQDYFTPSYYSVWDSVKDRGELYWGEAKAANGSYVYGRTRFTKTDRGNKFNSTARPPSTPLAELGEVKSIKFFIHGQFSSDATITATHIDEQSRRITTKLTNPSSVISVLWNLAKWQPSGTPAKWASIISKTLRGTFNRCRSTVPTYEISDGGTATEVNFSQPRVLVELLPP